MKTNQKDLQRFEELCRCGTLLDRTVLEDAKAECRGLRITSVGTAADNVIYSCNSGVNTMLDLVIENISERTIRVSAFALELPWHNADFELLKKWSRTELNTRDGYVLPLFGPHGIHPSVVLNHQFGRDFRLHPGQQTLGFLLGSGTAPVPDDWHDGMLITLKVTIFTGRADSYEAFVTASLNRKKESIGSSRSRQHRLLHASRP
jgi:hypothetical protein